MSYFQVNLASGKIIFLEAPSAAEAKENALREHGMPDYREKVLQVLEMQLNDDCWR
jgi:hypothetical protein